MGTAHYFSTGEKIQASELEPLSVTLAGRKLQLRGAAGVFSAQGLDKATKILLENTPLPPGLGERESTCVDVGCGWGPIALSLALELPRARVWAVDVNQRALALTSLNAQTAGVAERVSVGEPESVAAALPAAGVDLIWSNPPVRIGKAQLHELLAFWLPRLNAQGEARLVVGKNLGADPLAQWISSELGFHVERYASKQGFRLLRVSQA